MTGTPQPPPTVYPQYCFHLSPTIGRWCPLRAAEVQALRAHPGFEGQDLYFHDNHPIKWIRVVGVVVAVDEYPPWRVYTVDDSSGANIECSAKIVQAAKGVSATPGDAARTGEKTAQQQQEGLHGATAANQRSDGASASSEPAPAAGSGIEGDVDREIDVGHVVEVRGGIRQFRQFKQIRIVKVIHVGSTDQEVRFWNKLIQFRQDILNHSWVLDKRTVKRCRREAEGPDEEASDRKKRRKQKAARERANAKDDQPLQATGPERSTGLERATGLERTRGLERKTGLERATGLERPTGPERTTGLERATDPVRELGLERRAAKDKAAGPEKMVTGLEKKAKRPRKSIQVEGKYSALGI